MLTPEFLLRIVEAAEEKTAELNTYLTNRIVKRVMALFTKEGNVDFNPASVSDMRKMQETGKLVEEINQELQGKMPEIRKEIKKAFVKAANQIEVDNDRFLHKAVEFEMEVGNQIDIELPKISDYEKSGIPKPAKDLHLTKKEVRLLERAYRLTNGTMHNLTRTTAEAWQKQYIEAVDKAYWKATHGVNSNTAIAEAIEECAHSGSMVLYPSGHRDRIETAIARAVRAGVSQAAADICLTRCAETGVDTVIVSSHSGARYTDKEEPSNHMSWQGKVYALDWNNDKLKDYRVTEEEQKENKKMFAFFDRIKEFFSGRKEETAGDFIAITGYGTGEGLCGWGCRHHFGPYRKGINMNNNPRYDSEKDKELYNMEQKQRTKEREIRELKRRRQALKTAMDECQDPELRKELQDKLQTTSERLNKKREAYKDLCEENNLKTKEERLKLPENKKAIDKFPQNATMGKAKEEKASTVVEYKKVGKIDSSVFESKYGKLRTTEVILTDEREAHIKEHHPQDFDLFEKFGKDCVNNPNLIISDEKNPGTVYMIKKLPDTNLNVVLRLALNTDEKELKNSIITFWRIRNSNLKKLQKKNALLYKDE